MELNDKKKTQAEYDRFVDFMARMYLKYGTKYRVATAEDIIKMFQNDNPKRNLCRENMNGKGLNGSFPTQWIVEDIKIKI